MAYAIISGGDVGALAQRRETATAALDLVKELQAKNVKNIKVTDREGKPLTIADLERLSGKENI
jgi:hypothetical protein